MRKLDLKSCSVIHPAAVTWPAHSGVSVDLLVRLSYIMESTPLLPDNRFHKLRPKAPDFRDKSTKTLRATSRETPQWVLQVMRRKNPFQTVGGGRSQGGTASRGGSKSRNAADPKPPQLDQSPLTALMWQHVKCGQSKQALDIYDELRSSRVKPSSYTFVAALKACSNLQDLESAKQIHADIVKSEFKSVVFVGNMLVDAFAKCGSLVDARRIFEKMPYRNVVSWNAMIVGCAHMKEGKEALQLYRQMQQVGVLPDGRTFVGVLKACSSLAASENLNESEVVLLGKGCLEQVRTIHCDILKHGFLSDIFVGTMLVDVYAKCRSLVDARNVFDKMLQKNVVAWNAMISGYAQMEGKEALLLFAQMQRESVVPNERTFIAVLKACGHIATLEEEGRICDCERVKKQCLEQVRAVHSDIVNSGVETDVFVQNTLVDVYAKCGSLGDARHVFEKMPHRNLVSWNAMILGYAQMEEGTIALQLYARMQLEGVLGDARTLVAALRACSSLAQGEGSDENRVKNWCLQQVRSIHSHVVANGLECDVFVGNMLVDVYAKCGSHMDARCVFEKMPHRNVVAWTSIISGYALMGKGEESLRLYTRMKRDGAVPNARTFVGALKACSILAALEGKTGGEGRALNVYCLKQVREIHCDIVNSGAELDVFVATMLVSVYSKCGSLLDARRVFEKMPHRNAVSWTAMIFGYVQMEAGEEALQLYERMQQERVAPDAQVFVGVLKACGKLATFGEAKGNRILSKKRCLEQVRAIHTDIVKCGSESDLYVGTMLVDVYAKCGNLVDARSVFEKMPQRNVVSWTAMILGYALIEEGNVALQLYAQMQNEGVVPNDRTFVGALKACGSIAGLEKGKEIHAEILRTGLEAIDSIVASSLIDMYGKCGTMVEAQQVFDALPTRDIPTWSALIAGYACQGQSNTVFTLLERMRQEGIQPNSSIFLSILTVCSHVGLVDEGQRYFRAMITDYNMDPGVDHYTCMVDLLGRAGQLDKAMAVITTMPFEPDGAVWRTLLGSCRKWSNVEVGRQAFECAVRLDINDAAAYVLMLNIYAAAHMWEDAKAIQAMRVKTQTWKKPGQSWSTDVGGGLHGFLAEDQEDFEIQGTSAKLEELFVRSGEGTYITSLR